MPIEVSIAIVPVGDLDIEALKYLEKELKARFGDCVICDEIQIPAKAYRPQRKQYLAGILLRGPCYSKRDRGSGSNRGGSVFIKTEFCLWTSTTSG